jgi:hypothetical protein
MRVGVQLTSNSWGNGAYSQALLDAINAAGDAGELFVAAAGNSGADTDYSPEFPAAYDTPYVISVGASDDDDLAPSFTNWGPTTVDIMAPGTDILSLAPGGGYRLLSGTSMAAPQVAGVAGLVYGRYPGILPLQVKTLIMNGADRRSGLTGRCVTGGRLNAVLALSEPDRVAPSAVADLAVTAPGSNTLDLAWSAPGDDGTVGRAMAYEVRYSNAPITEANFAAATRVAGPDPLPAGGTQSLRIVGLAFQTTYWVALRATDDFLNAGAISNVVSATTLGIPRAGAGPDSLAVEVDAGHAVTRTLTLRNDGAGTLDFTLPVPDIQFDDTPSFTYVPMAKGQTDHRSGQVDPVGVGGPDAFGYRWIDSDEPGGPAYQWVEINGVGTPLSLGDDTYTASLPMGITFPWYGNNYTTLHVSTNGFVSFTAPSGLYYTNGGIPSTADPDDMVGAYWDDLNAADGGHVYTYQDVANARFIIEWDAVPLFRTGGGGPPQTFEIILNADGSVATQYKTVTEATSATVGIENVDGSVGLQIVFNAAYLHNALATLFTTAPPVPWLSVSPAGGSVPAQGVQDVTATYNSTGLAFGDYHAVLRLTTNDPNHATVDVPVALTVSNATGVVAGVDVPTAFELGEPSPNPFGLTTSIRFAIPVDGRHVRISVFDVAGRRVRMLWNGTPGVGRHVTTWDGRDAAGQRVASGVYFYRMDAGDFSQVRKVTVLK